MKEEEDTLEVRLYLRDNESTAQLLQQAQVQYPELFTDTHFSRVNE